jgi:putative ubiquitin-RnfH superfamily antitoxin RatB of RatAB toxin-antitoxin module
MRIVVVLALPTRQDVVELDLPDGSTVADAIREADVAARCGIDVSRLKAGVWSRAVERSALLRDGDRVELYRELEADPKDARRARARLKPSTRSRSGP